MFKTMPFLSVRSRQHKLSIGAVALVCVAICVAAAFKLTHSYSGSLTTPVPPYLFDVSGRYRIGPAVTPRGQELVAAGATSIIYSKATGNLVGAYVDDDQPGGRTEEVALLKSVLALKPGILMAGLAPSYRRIRIAGVTNAYELYPWGNMPLKYWLPLQRYGAYIVQRRFAFPGEPRPTYRQYMELVRLVRREHPHMIWGY